MVASGLPHHRHRQLLGGENMGDWTVTNNWSSNGSTTITTRGTGNVVEATWSGAR